MKIVYITGESYLDHSYTVVKELAKHVHLKVFFSARRRTVEVNSWLEKFGAEFIPRMRFRNPLALFRELGFILKLRGLRADCLCFNTLNIYQVYLAKFFLKNYLVMVHDVVLHPESDDKHGILSVRLTLKYHNNHICVASRTQAEIFEKQFGFKPMVFQLPVIDYYSEAGTPIPNRKLSEKVRFFFFGSVEKYKGLEILLDAAEILETKGLEYELSIFGRLKYDEDKFVERIKSLKSVNLVNKFIDYKEIHGIYTNGDMIVLPYKQVTQCGPLLIGYSESLPAIVSEQQGFREYVDEGKSALVFDNTANGLARKMEQVISEPSQLNRMREYIKTTIHNKYGMQSIVEEYLRNFREFKEKV